MTSKRRTAQSSDQRADLHRAALPERSTRAAGSAAKRLPEELATRDMEMFFFARFHTRAGCEAEFEDAFRDVAGPSREEPGFDHALDVSRTTLVD